MFNALAGSHYALLPPPTRSGRSPIERFRAWRERTLPGASYQLEPAFWTSARRRTLSRYDAAALRALKRREPQVTGLAYTDRAVYLVTAAKAGYAHAAKLMQCRRLMRTDPDYATHGRKRVFLVLLCDEWPRKEAESPTANASVCSRRSLPCRLKSPNRAVRM